MSDWFQYLLVGAWDNPVVVIFDNDGNFVERRELDEGFANNVEKVWRAISDAPVRDGVIKVKRFYIDSDDVGIEDVEPATREYIFGIGEFSEEEREVYRAQLDEWFEEQQYVLWVFGEDYWMSKDGYVEST